MASPDDKAADTSIQDAMLPRRRQAQTLVANHDLESNDRRPHSPDGRNAAVDGRLSLEQVPRVVGAQAFSPASHFGGN